MCVIASRLGCLHRLARAAKRGWQDAAKTQLGTIEKIGAPFFTRNRKNCFRCASHRVFDAPLGARQCTECVFQNSSVQLSRRLTIRERRFSRSGCHFESFNNAWLLEALLSRPAALQRVTFSSSCGQLKTSHSWLAPQFARLSRIGAKAEEAFSSSVRLVRTSGHGHLSRALT